MTDNTLALARQRLLEPGEPVHLDPREQMVRHVRLVVDRAATG